jgi:phosphatidylglycerol---prolipoprotein diacylglyceryl transferase
VHPILFRLGAVAVPAHPTFIVLGALAALAVFVREARRRASWDEDLFWIATGTLLAGAVGAHVGTGLHYARLRPDAGLLEIWVQGGRSILGGLAGAYAGALLTKRLRGYHASTGDLFAPAVALGMAIGRWGCFLSEQVGTPTTLPWGLRLDAATAARIPNCPWCATGVAMHPSFLYEIAFHLAAFAWLVRRRDDAGVPGDRFKRYLLAYAVFRFLVEFVRGNELVWHGLTRSQLFLIPSSALLVWYFAVTRPRRLRARGRAAWDRLAAPSPLAPTP